MNKAKAQFKLCATALIFFTLSQTGCVSTNNASIPTENTSTFKAILLGTGTPVSGAKRFGPSILVEAGSNRYIFDCGRGCGIRLQQVYGVRDFHKADTVFLTHLHSDHITGLPEVFLNGRAQGSATPLRVYGPKRTKEMMDHMRLAFDADIGFRSFEDQAFGRPQNIPGAEVVAQDIEEGIVLQEDGVMITAFLVEHKHIKPAFGFRVNYMDRAIVISGDTAPSENLIKYAKGADVLIHEVMSPALIQKLEKQFNGKKEIVNFITDIHTKPEEAADIFQKTKPKLAVFYHTSGTAQENTELLDVVAQTYAGDVIVGDDLMEIIVGNSISVVADQNR